MRGFGRVRALVLLCALSTIDASVNLKDGSVMDYLDFAKNGLLWHGNKTLYFYGTCDASAVAYMKNFVFRDNATKKIIATLADLVTGNKTDQATGLKTPLVMPWNINFTTTDDNPAGTPSTPYYIYVTEKETTVYDANFAGKVSANGSATIMSPFSVLTLRSFDTGNADEATISVTPPTGNGGTILRVMQKTGNLSIAKILGPIATVTPNRAGASFSFVVDKNAGFTSTFSPGGSLGYSSPGYSGNSRRPYAHPLAGKASDVIFKPDVARFDTSIGVSYSNTEDASIAIDNGDPIGFNGLLGSSSASGFSATIIKIHFSKGGDLEATFYTSNAGSSAIVAWSAVLVVLYSYFWRC